MKECNTNKILIYIIYTPKFVFENLMLAINIFFSNSFMQWLGHVRRSISSYPNSYGRPKDHLNEMERMPTEDNTSKENMISRS